MKKALVLLISINIVFMLTSCLKEAGMESKTKTPNATEINLKSLEPDVIIKGSGDKNDYDKIVVKDLVKKEKCKWEVVSGIIEYYYQDEMVFLIDFGNGNCDGFATVSWLENDVLESKDVDVWALFKQDNKDYVIVQELVKNENCDFEIVSGIIEYQDKEGNAYVTIDFGDGNCDGIASKCWTKDGVIECKDFDVHCWDGKF